ncbi:MAG: MBL fold metallo-hydrolase [Myxococcales bacterium]
MSLFVKFWGVRGSIPTPGHGTARYGGNTPCIEIRTDRTLLVCDGGSGLREFGVDLMRRCGRAPINVHMFFSHPHWDHIQGFPFFTPAYLPTSTLHVYGPAKGDHTIHDLLSGQMQSAYFPVDFSQLGAKVILSELMAEGTEVAGVKVRSKALQHPGGSLGFSFEYEGSRVVYATDNELDLLLPERPKAGAPSDAPRTLPAPIVEFCRDADLLIADGQYTDAEYPSKIGWGHPRATTLVDLAAQANVKMLAVTHHDPMQSDHDVEAKIADCTRRAALLRAPVQIFSAREGVELKLA